MTDAHFEGSTPHHIHDDAPESRGLVPVHESEPEASLWPEDTDEDGEVLTRPWWQRP